MAKDLLNTPGTVFIINYIVCFYYFDFMLRVCETVLNLIFLLASIEIVFFRLF